MIGRAATAILCFVLAVLFPLNVAGELLMTLPSLGMRGPVALLELTAHVAIAVLCLAAAMALWDRRAHGPSLARAAIVAVTASIVQSLYWSILPSQTKPGDELPLAALALLHGAAWLLFLHRSTSLRVAADEHLRS